MDTKTDAVKGAVEGAVSKVVDVQKSSLTQLFDEAADSGVNFDPSCVQVAAFNSMA
jgi:hypothetical protein